MRRLLWIGVGVGLTVLVARRGRAWLAEVVPEPATGTVDTAISVAKVLRHARSEFDAGWAAKETELMTALVGDRDPSTLAADGAAAREALRARRAHEDRWSRRISEDWADQPTEDPDDDDGYAF
ncbi:hypothetical protein [Cellulomonas citrea]|uniref:hypothetical protein n=1 Tax=Cellulomonas citrea TaxID=1909423 RepID=UPI001F3EA06A|nr:hypothetical protein [Cellulomonas citrea]